MKASQISGAGRGPLQKSWLRLGSFPVPPGSQSVCESARCESQDHKEFSAKRATNVNSGRQSFPSCRLDCPDPTRARRKRAQNEPESATRLAVQFGRKKAIPICMPGGLTWGHGRQSLPPASIGLPRSDTRAKKAGTKRAGISDAARHAIRHGEGNPDLHRRSLDLRSWSLKPSARRTGAGSIRDMGEESRHKEGRNQRWGAQRDSRRKKQCDSPHLTPPVGLWRPTR